MAHSPSWAFLSSACPSFRGRGAPSHVQCKGDHQVPFPCNRKGKGGGRGRWHKKIKTYRLPLMWRRLLAGADVTLCNLHNSPGRERLLLFYLADDNECCALILWSLEHSPRTIASTMDKTPLETRCPRAKEMDLWFKSLSCKHETRALDLQRYN